jgi:hypothetical protein
LRAPGQRPQEQRLQYGSNGAVPFPRHAQVAATAHPLPFPTDAWTHFKGPQHRIESKSLPPALLRAPPLSGRQRTRQQQGQPIKHASGREPSLLHCMHRTKLPESCLPSQRLLAKKGIRTSILPQLNQRGPHSCSLLSHPPCMHGPHASHFPLTLGPRESTSTSSQARQLRPSSLNTGLSGSRSHAKEQALSFLRYVVNAPRVQPQTASPEV